MPSDIVCKDLVNPKSWESNKEDRIVDIEHNYEPESSIAKVPKIKFYQDGPRMTFLNFSIDPYLTLMTAYLTPLVSLKIPKKYSQVLSVAARKPIMIFMALLVYSFIEV